jgi:hypothetical protein
MPNIKKSEYIFVSRLICKLLFQNGCFGKGSMYFDNLFKTINNRDNINNRNFSKNNINKILNALIKQNIICKKKKLHGWKLYLNIDRLNKIKEIIKEKGNESIIPILLLI